MVAAGIWIALLLFVMGVLRLHAWGRLVTYSAMALSFIAVFYLCERVVLLDRRAFTCKQCGYDLHGLSETRCPECGAQFDPAERDRILARINAPPPKQRHRWIAAIVVVLLTLAVVAGMDMYRRASRAAAKRAVAPATQPATPASP
jgi:hypothetical protein